MEAEILQPIKANDVIQRSPFQEAIRRLAHHSSARLGFSILLAIILVAIFAPRIAPYDPSLIIETAARRSTPCIHLFGCNMDQPEHILGLDGNCRDLFSRIVYGSRLSLIIGITSVSSAVLIGGLLGSISGYMGGWIGNIIMRIMDVLMAFPDLILAIAVVSVLGTGLINALMAVSIVSIPVYARLVRASILSVKEAEFVSASRALGASSLRLLFVRILPNCLTPLIVRGTLGIGTAIIEAAALSFLGLGAQPPTPEWGLMLGEEKNSLFSAPHLVIYPGIAIMLVVLSFNLLGDGLRDALDPRLH